MKNGEHWFHTKEQMDFLDAWLSQTIGYKNSGFDIGIFKEEKTDEKLPIYRSCGKNERV